MKKSLKFLSSEFLLNVVFTVSMLLLAKIFSPTTIVWLIPALFAIPYIVHTIKIGKITKLVNKKPEKDYYLITDKYMFSLVSTVLIYLPFTPFVILSLHTRNLLSTTTNWIWLFTSPIAIYILFVLFNPLLQKFSRS
jgi:hypothetical protein